MAFTNRYDPSEGFPVTVGKHPKNGKPVRFRARTLTTREKDECRREAWGKVKTRQLGRLSGDRFMERARVETIEYAIREFIDSENFDIRISPADVSLYSKELGREVKAGDEVLLDGHWTDTIKRDVFENTEGLAKRLDDGVGKVELGEAQEDDEDTEAF